MRYQLNIDIGVGSIGAVIFDLDKLEAGLNPLVNEYGGVARIFPASTGAAERRVAAGMQTQYQRRRLRVRKLQKELRALLSLDDADMHPIAEGDGTSLIRLRVQALERALSNRELFHAILHIAKNRGMRLAKNTSTEGKTKAAANTDSDSADQQKDLASLRQQARNLAAKINETGKTVAQILFEELEENNIATRRRQRLVPVNPYIVTRNLVIDEFDRILNAQAAFFPVLNDKNVQATLGDTVFWEAEPKPAIRGMSCYENDGKRLPKATWLFEEKRLLEELNNLRILDADGSNKRPLAIQDRNRLYDILMTKPAFSANEIKKELFGKKGKNHRISIEKSYSGKEGAERKIKGHAVSLAIRGTLLEKHWSDLDEARRLEVIKVISEGEDLEEILAYLKNLFPDAAEEELDRICDISLPQGLSAAGAQSTERLVKELRADVISLDEAEKRAGLVRVTAATGEIFERLPYYGRILGHRCQPVKTNPKPHDTNEEQFGRVPNPVVHQFLNQLRRIVNEFIKKHGLPEKIAVELSRDLQKTQEERDRLSRQNTSNEKANRARDDIISNHGKTPSRRYRVCLELHQLQGGKCPYTGENIAIEDIFSGGADIDHILPRAATLMDGKDNLVLTFSDVNRKKEKRPPYDAFSGGLTWNGKTIAYAEIMERVEKYPEEKRWKFHNDAMDRFKDNETFLKRFDGDTKWLGRVAIEYLRCLYDPARNPVRVVRGGITAQLRDHWGIRNLLKDLLEKEGLEISEKQKESARKFREDHRHHLIDAVVIGLANQKSIKDLQRFHSLPSRERKRLQENGEIKTPWPDFRKTIEDFIGDPGKVSQKPDRNINGQLHDQTALSLFARPEDAEDKSIIYQRISFGSMKPGPGKKGRELLEQIELPESVIIHARNLASGKVKGEFVLSAKEKKKGPSDRVAYLERYKAHLDQMRETLLDLFDNAPPQPVLADEEGEKVKKKIPDDQYRLTYALREYSRTHNKTQSWKKFESFTVVTLRGPAHGNTDRPQGLYKGRSNSRLDIYLDKNLDLGWEVVTRLNEMKNIKPKWKIGEGKLLFSLRKDDEVEMVNKGKMIIARIQKMSDGDICLFPIEVASSDDTHPKKIRICSLKSWKVADIRPIVRTPLGQVKFRGQIRNQ